MITDPIADMLTRLRNAQKARHMTVDIPSSKIKKSICEVLLDKGFIQGYVIIKGDDATIEEAKRGPQDILRVTLKYKVNMSHKEPVIVNIRRVSKPGLRRYSKSSEIPQVINGLGISILSTSRGVMSDKEARQQNIGGEILCNVY